MADTKPEEQVAQAQQGGRPAAATDAGDVAAQAPAPAPAKSSGRARAAAPGDAPAPGQQQDQPEDEAAGEPPPRVPEGVEWLVADEPLFISHPEAGVAPVRAYNAGDHVTAQAVDQYGWHGQTHVPEWAAAPPAPAPDQTGSEEHK